MRCESRRLIVRFEQKTKACPFQSCPLAKARLGYVHHPAAYAKRPRFQSKHESRMPLHQPHAAELLANPSSKAILEIG